MPTPDASTYTSLVKDSALANDYTAVDPIKFRVATSTGTGNLRSYNRGLISAVAPTTITTTAASTTTTVAPTTTTSSKSGTTIPPIAPPTTGAPAVIATTSAPTTTTTTAAPTTTTTTFNISNYVPYVPYAQLDILGNNLVGTFGNLSAYTSLVVPEGITTIGTGAFSYKRNFTKSLVLPDTVSVIQQYAFIDCANFTNAVLSKNLVDIGDYAFSNCYYIFPSVTYLPSSVRTIGHGSFGGCIITTVYVPSAATIQLDSFNPDTTVIRF